MRFSTPLLSFISGAVIILASSGLFLSIVIMIINGQIHYTTVFPSGGGRIYAVETPDIVLRASVAVILTFLGLLFFWAAKARDQRILM